jgi:uncharacterized membrane protein
VHFSADLMASWILAAAAGLTLLALAVALRTAQWRALRAEPGRMHLVAGGAVAVLLLWLLNIHLLDGVILHFLGVTTLTLVVGWSFTVLAATLSLAAFFALQDFAWTAFPLSVCLTVLVPATVTRLLLRALYRPALQHPFVYILGAGFAGGALVVLVLALLSLLLLGLSGQHGYLSGAYEWWPLLFLLMFSEAFINGMCVSALAIFYPDWMKTFDDRFYLDDG